MAVSAVITPGKIFTDGEAITISELNKLGAPTVDISGAVSGLALADGSVTNAKVAAGTGIQLDKVETGTDAQVIVANSSGEGVWKTVSGDATIDNAGALTIADNAITSAKIANTTITGTKITMGADVAGDILVYNGSQWTGLHAGVSGQFLKTQGSGATSIWATVTHPTPTDTATTAKAWAKFNNAGGLYDDFNVSSNDDVGTGQARLWFSTSIPSDSTAVSDCDLNADVAGLRLTNSFIPGGGPTTTYVDVYGHTGSAVIAHGGWGYRDANILHVIVFGT